MEHELIKVELIAATAQIVSGYVHANTLARHDLLALIREVRGALGEEVVPVALRQYAASGAPAVPREKSVSPEFITCLEDGMRFKSIRRHLFTAHNLTPEGYRKKWNLPASYPMTSQNYSRRRSELARGMLGANSGAQPPRKAPEG